MKIAVYVANDQTLGHVTRISSLLEGIKKNLKEKVSILILHSGKSKDGLNLHKFGEVVNLPFAVDRRWFELTRRIYMHHDILKRIKGAHLVKARQNLIKETLRSWRPDIFLTEYFPFGLEFWSFELLEVVKFLKANFGIRVVSSVGYPSYVPDTPKMAGYYDRVFFHYPRIETGYYRRLLKLHSKLDQLKGFDSCLRSYSDKICHTGYILNTKRPGLSKEEVRKSLAIKKNQKLVVVSRGGGVINRRIILYSILAAKRLKEAFFLISAGPATPGEELRFFRQQAGGLKNVKLVNYLDNFIDCLNAADLSVNMAGHNTIVRLLWLKKQSVIVPLDTIEQLYRTEMLLDFKLAKKLDRNNFSAENLALFIDKMLGKPLQPAKEIEALSFRGIEETVKGLRCLS